MSLRTPSVITFGRPPSGGWQTNSTVVRAPSSFDVVSACSIKNGRSTSEPGGDATRERAQLVGILEAARFRLPGVVLARMVVNTVVDLVVGAIPLIGDAFDFIFKSNTRNLALFRRHATDPGASTTEHRAFLAGLVLLLVGLLWLAVVAIGWLLSIQIPVS